MNGFLLTELKDRAVKGQEGPWLHRDYPSELDVSSNRVDICKSQVWKSQFFVFYHAFYCSCFVQSCDVVAYGVKKWRNGMLIYDITK